MVGWGKKSRISPKCGFSSLCIHPLPWQAAGMGGWRTPWHSVPILDQVSELADGAEGGISVLEELWPSFPRCFSAFCQEGESPGVAAQGKGWVLPQRVWGASLEGHCLVQNWPLIRLQWLLRFQLQSNSFQADACRFRGCQIPDATLHVRNCFQNLFAGPS